MSDETLRDLLEERVADLDTRDLAAGAWPEAVRRRRWRRAATLAGAAGLAAATALVVALTGPGSAPSRVPAPSGPAPAPSAVAPTPAEDATPDAVIGGARFWWSPDPAEEDALAPLDTRLPRQIDLSVRPGTDVPSGGALAAFGVVDERNRADRVVLVGPERVVAVDVSRLVPLDDGGNLLPPVTATMLSPSGAMLAFPQPGAVVFLDLTTGAWSEVEVGGSATEGLRWLDGTTVLLRDGTGLSVAGCCSTPDLPRRPAPRGIAPAAPYGPAVTRAAGGRTAQAYGFGAAALSSDSGLTDAETLVVDGGAALEVLAFPGPGDRFKLCCPVAGWVAPDTVLYESRSATPRLVAWRVGTSEFALVSRLVGLDTSVESYVGSFARLDTAATWRSPG